MKISKLSTTKEIIEKYDFKIKKKFGQNFLIDENILNNIVLKSNINEKTNVIEIGPGLGSLTQKLCENANKVLAFEIDETLIPILNENFSGINNLDIINKDFLKVDIDKTITKYFNDDSNISIVANLPYYITTAILIKILEESKKVNTITVMMQKEVADRLSSNKSTKDYNSLSVFVQYKSDVKKILKVPSSSFIPKPNVDSTVVKFNIKKEIDNKPNNEKLFFEIVRKSFSQRRKTLINNLSSNFNKSKNFFEEILIKLNFDTNIRAENLSIDDFIKLSNLLDKEL